MCSAFLIFRISHLCRIFFPIPFVSEGTSNDCPMFRDIIITLWNCIWLRPVWDVSCWSLLYLHGAGKKFLPGCLKSIPIPRNLFCMHRCFGSTWSRHYKKASVCQQINIGQNYTSRLVLLGEKHHHQQPQFFYLSLFLGNSKYTRYWKYPGLSISAV